VASLVLCVPVALRLELHTRFEHLLPESQTSVIELQRLNRLVRSNINAFVILEGPERKLLRQLGDGLVPRLQAVGPPWVVTAESGIHAARAFLLPRIGLFASQADLEKLLDDVQARWDHEVGKRAGTLIDDTPPPELSTDRLRKRFVGSQPSADRFRDGYFESTDGRALIVVARAQIAGGDLERGNEALRRIRAAVESVHRSRPEYASVKIGYAGELVTQVAEYGAVRDDLVQVGMLGSLMVLGVVVLFFMRLRVLHTLGLTIATGVAWTFALTYLTIGHLNMATGFLFSIVVGNGINSGIIYMARYFEERRHGASPAEAIDTSHRSTWLATLTAAIAAAAAYGSLGVTDFRAFKHFALIGASGMLLCWIATYFMLPSILVISDRLAPFRGDEKTLFHRLRLHGLSYGSLPAWLVGRAPRVIAVVGVLAAIAGAVGIAFYVRKNPMEYDARRLLNDMGSSRELSRLGELSSKILGARLEGSMIVVCDRIDQVQALRGVLEARKRNAPRGEKPFEAVHTLFDFVPEAQANKIPVLLDLKRLLVKARSKGFIGDADWRELRTVLPPDNLTPFTLKDLPEELAYPFTDTRGQRGTIVAIEPTTGQHDWDFKYLARWASAFRENVLPSGEVIRGSGRAVIYSDMISAVIGDIPKAVALSLGLTILAVLLSFRRWYAVGVVLSLLAGVAWVGGYLVASGTKIHFLNFIAIPITFGIGADYAVNFFQRYASRGELGVLDVLHTTGGAVVLCSLTTMLGYVALLGSINQAIRGLGALAVVGEITCLVAGVVLAPAVLLWLQRRRSSG
jgi:predicted exporter